MSFFSKRADINTIISEYHSKRSTKNPRGTERDPESDNELEELLEATDGANQSLSQGYMC